MSYYKKNICCWLLLLLASFGIAQDETTLKIIASAEQYPLPKNLEQQYIIADTNNIKLVLHNLIDSLQQASFLSASIDSLVKKENNYTAYLFLGAAYDDFQISDGNIETSIIKRARLDRFLHQSISYVQVQELQKSLLMDAENNGYPFAIVKLEDVRIKGTTIQGKLFWDKGKLMRISGIKTEGEVELATNYLENYLGLKKGNLYQKDKIISASQKLQELLFIKETRPPSVQFTEEEALINLFLATKKANRFDFLIGVLPNNTETGKVLITGNIDATFHNQFGKGERLHFEFEQLRPETQQLTLETSYPYLLNTPLGIDFEFGLYKRDSTYRDLIWNFGLQYLFEGGNYLKAFSKNTASALLAIDENGIIRNRQLPQNLDIRNTAFGLAYQLEKLDYRFNPRSGYLLQLEASAGFKEIRKNSKITDLQDVENPDFDFSTLYDNLELTTFQYQLRGRFDYFFPVQRRSAIKTSFQGASIIAEMPIFRNEQFRIGGNQLLRGFDEESIFATSYLMGTLEYRYLLGQNSYFFLFGDIAYVENKTIENDFTNRPIGIGAGMTFETKAGIFGISYALGKIEEAAFEFRKAKVHFGFISLF